MEPGSSSVAQTAPARARLIRQAVVAAVIISAGVGVALMSAAAASWQMETPEPEQIFEAGRISALAIDSNDLPVLFGAEYPPCLTASVDFTCPEVPPGQTYLLRCADVTCSAMRSTTLTDFGIGGRMVLDDQDRPLQFRTSAGALVITACADPQCFSHVERVVDFGDALEGDGRHKLRFVGWLATDTYVLLHGDRLVVCGDPLCTTPQISGEFIAEDEWLLSVTLDPSGLPAYTNYASEVVRCGDPLCAASTRNEVPGYEPRLIFGDSGFPIVASWDDGITSTDLLYNSLIMHCDDPLCVDEAEHSVPVVPNLWNYRKGQGVSGLYLLPGGIPVIAAYNLSFDGGQIFTSVGECATPHCAANPTRAHIDIGFRFSQLLAITDAGIPVFFTGEPVTPDVVDYPGSVDVYACAPGSACYIDGNANSEPDWLEPLSFRPTPTPIPPPPDASFEFGCSASNRGVARLYPGYYDRGNFSLRVGEREVNRHVQFFRPTQPLTLGDLPDGPLVARAIDDGELIATGADSVACQAPPVHRGAATCIDDVGRIDITVSATRSVLPATFDVHIGALAPRRVILTEADLGGPGQANRFEDAATVLVGASGRPYGWSAIRVVDVAAGQEVHNQRVFVACNEPDAPIPIDDRPATLRTSCLEGNGRVDFTIVERSSATGTWSIEFGDLSVRQRAVASKDWWRMPITGRPDGTYDYTVRRGDSIAAQGLITIACDDPGLLSVWDRSLVTSACRFGRGYILFQFVNATPDPKSWVIEFDGVPNRSTSAPAWGTAVRAVTGRPNGTYIAKVRDGPSYSVPVDC